MASLVSNLNEINDIKLQIRDVIGTDSYTFSEYPQLIEIAIATGGGGSYILSYYVTKEELSECGYLSSIPSEYITQEELSACGYITINDIPVIDLSSYVTKTELSNQSYASQTYVTDKIAEIPSVDLSAYVTKTELSNQSYLTTIPAEYITDSELSNMGYVTIDTLSSCGYATETYVANYVDTHGGGGSSVVIDENIIPKESDTYTLGNATYYYDSTYTNRLNGQGTGLTIKIGTNSRYGFYDAAFRPITNNTTSLGTSSNAWKYTYTYYVGTYGSGISVDNAQGLVFSINNNNRLYLGNSQFRPLTNNYVNFGTSTAKWKCVYTYDVYIDNQSINDIYATPAYVVSYVTNWGQSGTYNLVDRVEGLEDKTTQLDNRTYDLESYTSRVESLENAGYITQLSLSNNSYATTTYVVDTVNEIAGQIARTDGNIIPAEDNTYILGDASHLYAAAYTYNIKLSSSTRIYNDNNSITFSVNNYNGMKMGQTNFSPRSVGNYDLGTSSIPWKNTYTSYLYLNGTNVNDTFVTQTDLSGRGFITNAALDPYATKAYVMEKIPASYDMSLYVTYTYLYSYVGNVCGDIETLLANI